MNWELTPDLLLPVDHFKEMMWKACDFVRSLEGEEISQGSMLFTNLFHLLKVSTMYVWGVLLTYFQILTVVFRFMCYN